MSASWRQRPMARVGQHSWHSYSMSWLMPAVEREATRRHSPHHAGSTGTYISWASRGKRQNYLSCASGKTKHSFLSLRLLRLRPYGCWSLLDQLLNTRLETGTWTHTKDNKKHLKAKLLHSCSHFVVKQKGLDKLSIGPRGHRFISRLAWKLSKDLQVS